MNAYSYIIKTYSEGVKVLIIDDLNSQQFSLKILLKADESFMNCSSDCLQLQITDPSEIVIATTQNERVGE
jgi:hypothetical protein